MMKNHQFDRACHTENHGPMILQKWQLGNVNCDLVRKLANPAIIDHS
jgi:hypothetical protein